MTSMRGASAAAMIAVLCAVVPAAQGAILLQEGFDTDTTTTAETLATYPAFTLAGGGNAVVTSGRLRMSGTGITQRFWTASGFAGDLAVSLGAGNDPGGGSSNVGLAIGGNRIVFHPGYGGGALRVEGPGGFGNQNMGFMPPGGGALTTMEVAVSAGTGDFVIAVANPSNTDQVFVRRFTNPFYAPGVDQIGPTRSTAGADWTGVFDDLQIAELKSTSSSVLWGNVITPSDPLHWYSLDETDGLFAIDKGRGGLHGVYQNGIVRGVPGLDGQGVLFDGVNDQIYLGGSDLGGPWTAEFIVEKQGIEQAGSLMRSASTALRLDQWNNTGEVGYTRFGVADYRFTPAVSADVGDLTHLAYVADPSSGIQVYINGILAGSNGSFINLPRGTIGSASDAANAFVDEVVIYDRALSGEEIALHAWAATNTPEPSTLALLALGGLGLLRRRRR